MPSQQQPEAVEADDIRAAQTARLERSARLAIWVVPALWAVNYIVARRAPGIVEPYALALGRWAIAGMLLAIVARQELWTQRHAVSGAALRSGCGLGGAG